MAKKSEEIKDYFEEKAEQVIDRMEKTPARKLIIVILVLVSFGVLSLGYLQIKRQMERPFFAEKIIEDKANIRGPREILEFYQQEQRNREELTQLQRTDSDGDGLSDYHEIYIYRTNVYSQDTDGDGEVDQVEVVNGTDPNCPKGQSCDAEGFVVSGTGPTRHVGGVAVPGSDDIDVGQIIDSVDLGLEQLDEFSTTEKDQLGEYFRSLSPQDLRTLLLQQGFPQEQLDVLTDDELQGTLQRILNSL